MTKEEMLKDDFVATHYGDRARNWVDPAFIDGAEWMQEKMIEKAAEWLSNNMFHSVNNGVQINGTCVSDFVEKFKQTMEDESK